MDDDTTIKDRLKEQRSLVGKLSANRSIGVYVLRVTMGKIWKITKPTLFKTVGRNIFTITFATLADKQKVIDGSITSSCPQAA